MADGALLQAVLSHLLEADTLLEKIKDDTLVRKQS